MINKKNLPLYIALAVPVLMIFLVAGFIYLPSLGKKPAHNFVYASGRGAYYYGYSQGGYQVVNGRLIYEPPAIPYNSSINDDIHFYIYDVASNQSREVSVSDAQSYKLDSSIASSDGYVVERGNSGGGGGLLFGGVPGDYNSWFIKGHNHSTKLNLKLTGGDYYSNFRFLGWIE